MFALICSMGVSTGYHQLIGLYTTKEKAEKEKERDIQKTVRGKWHYSIKEIEIDKPVNIIYNEW